MAFVKELTGVVALLAIPAFVLRALFVSHFDLNTATALVMNTSITQLIYTLFLVTIPGLMIAPVFLAPAIMLKWPRTERFWIPKRIGVLVTLEILTMPYLFSLKWEWNTLLVVALLLVAPGVLAFAPRRIAGKEITGELHLNFPGVMGLVFIVLATIIGTGIWLPPERIVVSGTVKTYYVLSAADDALDVFDAKANIVLRVPKNKIGDRQFCELPATRATVGMKLFGGSQGRPQCP